MKLDEQAVMDLADHLNKKCARLMVGTLSLTDDNSQRMVIATQTAALAFGMAARFMQVSAASKGLSFDWNQCVDGVVAHVTKLAKANPPDELAEKLAVPR
jgi:hypothetical protein